MKLFLVAALVLLLSVSSYGKPALSAALCPNLVNCFVNPCQFSRCSAHPNAKCVANYCGGCNAFWYLDGKRVECSAPAAVAAPAIEIEQPCIMVNCFVDPCGFAKCNKNPSANCRPNYCGGCNARFYNSQGQRVQCD